MVLVLVVFGFDVLGCLAGLGVGDEGSDVPDGVDQALGDEGVDYFAGGASSDPELFRHAGFARDGIAGLVVAGLDAAADLVEDLL